MANFQAPTPLIDPASRPPVPIAEHLSGTHLRRLRVCGHLGLVLLRMVLLKLSGRFTVTKAGHLIANYCQQMGLLWVKFGQVLSVRSDIFPPALCDVLGRLHERALGFSPDLARETLARELGEPLEKVFSSFEEQPCAAASIAQVHRAVLRENGATVAVKIRRPDIDKIFALDLKLITGLFTLFKRLSLMTYMRWDDLVWEMTQVFTEELDYRYELTNQQRLGKNLENHEVLVPRVYPQYSTRRLLVMDFVNGVSMSEYQKVCQQDPQRARDWCRENHINPDQVGQNLLLSYLRQVLEENLFHADLHPGNIFLLRNNRIALIDFGSIGSIEADLLRKYDAYLNALAKGQYLKAIDVFVLTAPNMPTSNLGPLKEELLRGLQSWHARCRVPELPYKHKSASAVSDEMMRSITKYGFTILWAFFKLMRGWMTMDACLRDLIPRADLPGMMLTYLKSRKSREFRDAITHLPEDLIGLQIFIDFPREQTEMALHQGAAIRRLAQVFEGTSTRVSRLLSTLFAAGSTLFLTLCLFSAGLMGHQHGLLAHGLHDLIVWAAPLTPAIDLQVWILVLVLCAYISANLIQLAIRFRKQD